MKKELETNIIKIDAANWKTVSDFYGAILPKLGAPVWHGGSVDALVESMVWGDINDVEPPYTIQIHSTKNLPSDVLQQMTWVRDFLAESRAEFNRRIGHDIEVDFQMFD